jgi:hypothetical protein
MNGTILGTSSEWKHTTLILLGPGSFHLA